MQQTFNLFIIVSADLNLSTTLIPQPFHTSHPQLLITKPPSSPNIVNPKMSYRIFQVIPKTTPAESTFTQLGLNEAEARFAYAARSTTIAFVIAVEGTVSDEGLEAIATMANATLEEHETKSGDRSANGKEVNNDKLIKRLGLNWTINYSARTVMTGGAL